jgi:hypothetical protein
MQEGREIGQQSENDEKKNKEYYLSHGGGN